MVQTKPTYGANCLLMVLIVYLWCRLDLLMVLTIYLWCLLSIYDGCYVLIVIRVLIKYALLMLKFAAFIYSMFTSCFLYVYIAW
jgi:hypothetical protein